MNEPLADSLLDALQCLRDQPDNLDCAFALATEIGQLAGQRRVEELDDYRPALENGKKALHELGKTVASARFGEGVLFAFYEFSCAYVEAVNRDSYRDVVDGCLGKPLHLAALRLLWRERLLSSELAKRLTKDRGQVSRALTDLLRAGLVALDSTEKVVGDRRGRPYKITEAGRRECDEREGGETEPQRVTSKHKMKHERLVQQRTTRQKASAQHLTPTERPKELAVLEECFSRRVEADSVALDNDEYEALLSAFPDLAQVLPKPALQQPVNLQWLLDRIYARREGNRTLKEGNPRLASEVGLWRQDARLIQDLLDRLCHPDLAEDITPNRDEFDLLYRREAWFREQYRNQEEAEYEVLSAKSDKLELSKYLDFIDKKGEIRTDMRAKMGAFMRAWIRRSNEAVGRARSEARLHPVG
jgi:DNA-binding MarR family transcriptional regulator